jgi:hypothetical protein
MELTSITLGASAVVAIGGLAIEGPVESNQSDNPPAYTAACKNPLHTVSFAEASDALSSAKVSARFILDPTVAQVSCQA